MKPVNPTYDSSNIVTGQKLLASIYQKHGSGWKLNSPILKDHQRRNAELNKSKMMKMMEKKMRKRMRKNAIPTKPAFDSFPVCQIVKGKCVTIKTPELDLVEVEI